jgi:hypothetical protein
MSAGMVGFTVQRRRCSRRWRPVQRPSEELHVVTFHTLPAGLHPQFAVILVRGRMGQDAAMDLACAQARPMSAEAPLLTDISTVPAPRPTPSLDALTRRHTAFPGFVALLTAARGYRPSIRLDLLGKDGLVLALAYDRQQAAWGDPRRAFVTGQVPRRATAGAA